MRTILGSLGATLAAMLAMTRHPRSCAACPTAIEYGVIMA